jgi:hypothetical protein
MALLDSFYGETPSYLTGLLGEDELNRLQQQARNQSDLSIASALLQAGAPSRTPTSGALAIAQGLQMGQQAYKNALNQGLQEKMVAMQLGEQMRKAKEAEAVRQFLPNLIQPGAIEQNWSGAPEQIADYFKVKGQAQIPMAQTAPSINRDALMQLAIASPEAFAKYKSLLPEYKFEGGMAYEVSPFGGVKQVGGQDKSLQLTGEESNIALRLFGTNNAAELAKIPNSSKAIEQASIALKKAGATSINMPTGDERKSAVLANRMNFGVQQMNQAIGAEPTAAMPNTVAETARFFTRTDFLPNKLNTEQRQIVEGAQLDVLDAALTLGTGAAYTREQLEGYRKSYFPQLEDKPETIRSKQARLQNLLESAQIASGRAASTIPTPLPKQQPVQYPTTTEQSTLPGGVIVRKRQ